MSSRTRMPFLLLCLILIAAEPFAATQGGNPLAGDGEKQLPARPFMRLGTPRLQQEHGLAVVFSPDGKTLAIHDSLWDVYTGKKLRDLQMSELASGGIWNLAFAPDGKVVAGQQQYGVRLWETATGKEIRLLFSSELSNFHALTFSPDGKQLATSVYSEEKKAYHVLLWERATGREIRRFAGQADQLAFSPDGKRLRAFVSQFTLPYLIRESPHSGSLVAWDTASGKQLFSRSKAALGKLSHDGRLYTLQGEDGRIEIHDVEKRRLVRILETRDIWHVFSADGKILASANKDNTIRLWDLATSRMVKEMHGRREESKERDTVYYPFGFSPDGKFLASGSHDNGNHAGRIRLWDVRKGEEVLPAEDHYLTVTSVAFRGDGKMLVSGSGDRTLHLWETATGRHLRRFTGHKDTIDAVAISPTGRFLASSSRDKTLRLWDAGTGRELHCLDAPADGVLSLTFLEDDTTLQWWNLHGNIYCYDVGSGKRIRRFRSRRGVIYVAPPGAGGLSLPIRFTTNVLRRWPKDWLPSVFWKKQTNDPTLKEEQFQALQPVRVSADGRMAATVETVSLGGLGGPQCRLRVWEVATGGLIADLGELSGISQLPVFSLNGWGLFTGGAEWGGLSCHGWDLLSRKAVVHLQAPSAETLCCLTVSPDGTKVAVGGEGASLFVCDITGLFRLATAPPLADVELRRLADCLRETDAAAAYRAMYRLARSPAQTVPFLHQRLRKLAPPMSQLRRLIAALDDDNFNEREKATKTLEGLGSPVKSALQDARENTASPEVRRRLDSVLEKLSEVQSQRTILEVLRGASVLERIGTVKARAALHDLAEAASDSDVGREANAALHRLIHVPIRP